jgi:hypothetical protein
MRSRRRDGGHRLDWAVTTASVCALWASGLQAAPLTAVGYNVESGDANDRVIGLQLQQSRGIDIWGLADVWPQGGWVETLHDAARKAEGLDYGVLVGETGGSDRLMLLYRTDRLAMLDHDELLSARVHAREPAPLVARMRLSDGADTAEFLVLLVRLSDVDKRRRAQADVIAQWARRQHLPVVALGTLPFGLAEGAGPGPDLQRFLDASGWQWLRPARAHATSCDRGGRVDDFVLVGGAAADWGGRAEVMFPQNNYCPDSGRTSSHRPVLARFSTSGGALDAEAGMAERQTLPLLPGEIQTGVAESTADEAEIESLRKRIEELEAAQMPQTLPAAAPGSYGPEEVTTPVTAPAAEAGDEALRRRLQALEAEVRALREQLEGS